MHLGQETRYGGSEPAPAAGLEPAEMAAPICGAENGIRVLLELFVGDGFVGRDLEHFVRAIGRVAGVVDGERVPKLTGSSLALIAKYGILMASTASTLAASR